MPYISMNRRKLYDEKVNELCDSLRENSKSDLTGMAGDFTYIIYRLLKVFNGKFFLRALGIGCLVCAILEIYRRDHTLYENEKIQIEGDVN